LRDQISQGGDIGPVIAVETHDKLRCNTAIIGWQDTQIIPIAKTVGPEKMTALQQSPEMKRCVPPGTTAGRSGSGGRDTSSEAGLT
jgi:hypothetical protein